VKYVFYVLLLIFHSQTNSGFEGFEFYDQERGRMEGDTDEHPTDPREDEP